MRKPILSRLSLVIALALSSGTAFADNTAEMNKNLRLAASIDDDDAIRQSVVEQLQ